MWLHPIVIDAQDWRIEAIECLGVSGSVRWKGSTSIDVSIMNIVGLRKQVKTCESNAMQANRKITDAAPYSGTASELLLHMADELAVADRNAFVVRRFWHLAVQVWRKEKAP